MRLITCGGCGRHVRVDEGNCPFCDAEVVAPREPGRVPLGRLGRAALFAFGATLGATSVGCVDSTTPTDAGFDAGGPAPAYGAVPVDAGPPPGDSGGAMTLYGGAPGD